MAIRTQILLAVSVLSLLIIAGFAAVVVNRVQARATALAEEAATENAQLVVFVVSRGLEGTGVSFDTLVKTLERSRWLLGAGGPTTRVQLFDAHARLRFDSARDDVDAAPRPEVLAALSGGAAPPPHVLPGSRVAAAVPIHVGAQTLGAVRVVRPVLGMEEVLRSLAPEIAALALAFFALAVLAAGVLGRRISTPLTSLTEAARRIAAGDRGHVLPVPRGREVRALTLAYAEMRRRLEDTREIERLAQDLSHELKNPLASILALSEALEDGALHDDDAKPRLLASLRRAAQRMESIIGDLLLLARLEAQGLERPVELRFDAVVLEAVEAVSARAAARGVQLHVNAAPATVCGDGVWLGRAVVNLFANAVEHAPDEGSVSVRLHHERGCCVVTVMNPGAVDPSVRSRLFERFATRRPEGTGLGLSIARGVAEAHGGTVTLVEAGPPCVVIAFSVQGRAPSPVGSRTSHAIGEGPLGRHAAG